MQRVPRPKTAARRYYDRLSRWYDWLAGSEHTFTDAALDLLAARSGEAVLEIGFGAGRSLERLAGEAGPAGRTAGVDLSWGMARAARERLHHAGCGAALHLADAAALPFAAQCFDAVFISFTLELFDSPEIPRVLGEIRRVLRPRGRLAVAALDRPDPPGTAVRVYEWFHRALPVLVDCRPIPLDGLLGAAGFTIQHCRRGWMWGLPVAVALGWKADCSGSTAPISEFASTKPA